MSDEKPLDHESLAVQTHLTLLQGVINRMAGNSAVCKTLCATLVSTVGAISFAAVEPNGMWISILPILIFAFLDTRYLALEKGFRNTYDMFVADLYEGKIARDKLFKIAPPPGYNECEAMLKAAKSWAVYPIYVSLLILAFALWWII